MGVHGLWRLLESTGKPINPETLEGKILAVDISIWLNQAVKGVRDREGNSVQNAHLLTLFHRICKLLFFRIRPVFVFDGDAPLLKKQTLALRRQRKEELSRESKQTNEKLLKTFLKRQAIKAALGDRSKDPLPSLSSVRRDEVDDMYVLPALPAAEEKDKSSSEEEEEKEREEMDDSYHMYQGELYDDPNSVDINSEEFACLPPEMKHEILKDMKEFSKRRRTMYHKPPEQSGDFSQYQLAGLLQRNKLNQRLMGLEKEMSQQSAGSAPQLYEQDGEQQSHSVESQRLVSEDHSHYILIKGSKKKNETASESQPAAAPWSGGFLSGSKRRPADRPEPLWRPVCEEEEKAHASSSEDSKPSVSKPSQGDTSPPSPRTLQAIQAAMNNSSDEEKADWDERGGGLSPRTQLAIQKALAEDDTAGHGTLIDSSSTKVQANTDHPVPQVVISSSEEEPEPQHVNSLLSEKNDFKVNLTGQRLDVKDSVLNSSSEDEMEELIGRRNKALHLAALQNPQTRLEEETEKGRVSDAEQRLITKNGVQPQAAAASDQNSLSINNSTQILGNPLSVETELRPVLSEQRGDKTPEGDRSEESESEESFIEVSEEELKEEDEDDSLVIIRDEGSPDKLHKEEEEESSSEGPSSPDAASTLEEDKERQTEEKELKETESSSTPETNEWEHFDADELEALESSLQAEQSSLRELKQQQERMANTVTGQMYLESQELLRLFGVPFLVAPMEAEAQCAALDRADHTHGTITDDSDVWLFGGRHVYRNFFSQNKYVEHYQYADMQNQLGLDRAKMINLAYLLGSDYTEGVPGVGYVTGMEILNEFPGPGLEPLIQLSKWWSEAQEKKRLVADPRDTKVKKKLRSLKLHPGFPSPAVAQAYLEPAVDHRKTEETLQPVIKQLNTQQTQLRIDSFFRMEQQEKQAIRSQRLRRAVTCMKRKEREGGEEEEEEEDSEEEMPVPSKRGKATSKSPKKGGDGVREEARSAAAGGGFLGSQVIVEPSLTPSKHAGTSQESPSVKNVPQPTETLPQRISSSSSSSGEDSDGSGEVAMVTARSVFEGGRRGRGAKSTRGRGSTRGKGRGKK
ncbi:DNA repair protein complementing XP-G cells -like protein [Collichthys lucidus]|uniref:DNA repair protein complementing XP-G cells-like protein n=1 Tax=Collichthys lucidus TaxID=240159 RepID=A0A4U5U7X0_COLLU|nr:DNA repair protein complementing XP-G cells -like protein [Collichthys lucidus]